MDEKRLEVKMCVECGKTPVLVVHGAPMFLPEIGGMRIQVRVTEACDPCFEKFLKMRGSSGQGFYFA